MLKLLFLSAVPGAGKSYVALQDVYGRAGRGEWILIVVPTVALAEEARARLLQFGQNIVPEVIHHKAHLNVRGALLSAINERPEYGRILIITWSAFEALPFFPGRELWSVVVDEIPQLAVADELNVPVTHAHLTSHVELRPMGPVWARIVVKSKAALRKLADTGDTSLKSTLAPVARKLLSSYWTTYVRSQSFHSLLSGKGKKLTLHHVLRPRIFESFKRVTILGANFKHSLLHLHWSKEGVVFEEDEALRRRLRLAGHAHSDCVTICYGLEEPWSKSVRDHQKGIIWDKLIAAVKDRMKGASFGWVANKDMGTDLFPAMDAECLPQVSHGLNAWQHLDNIVFLSARLPISDHFALLEWLGINGDQVRRTATLEPAYQTVLRGGIRDPNNHNPKTIVVPDRSAADFLHELLPGSRIEKLTMDLDGVAVRKPRGRPKKHVNGTGRVQHHRNQKQSEINRLTALMNSDPDMVSHEDFYKYQGLLKELLKEKTCNENPIKEGAFNSVTQNPLGSLFDRIPATHPVAIVTNVSVEMFIEVLRTAHKRPITRKEDNRAFSPAIFDPELSPETNHGLDNVVFANGIWLDFDYGNLTHKELAQLFPDVRLVVFNTFSSTKAQPRFRLYIPTSRIVTKEEYAFLTGQILQAIKDAGFRLPRKDPFRPHLKAHGIDMGKLHAASLFYMPCQPKDPKGKIWKDYAKREDGGRRGPLDVDDWLENAIPVDTHDDIPEPADGRPVDQARVDRAMERWRMIGVQEGNGDNELFVLHQELKAANVPRYERSVMLLDAARMASSPADRVRQARRLTQDG